MSFEQSLAFGKAAETQIARFLLGRGFNILPVYEKTDDEKKGPQLYTPAGSFIAPDLFVFRGADVFWVEAKHKTAFSWHRATARWVTGIDRKHFREYNEVMRLTGWPVWLFFLHLGGTAKDSPDGSPCGLFGNDLSYLVDHINHEHENWGKSGMVYWAHAHLKLIACLRDGQLVRGLEK